MYRDDAKFRVIRKYVNDATGYPINSALYLSEHAEQIERNDRQNLTLSSEILRFPMTVTVINLSLLLVLKRIDW